MTENQYQDVARVFPSRDVEGCRVFTLSPQWFMRVRPRNGRPGSRCKYVTNLIERISGTEVDHSDDFGFRSDVSHAMTSSDLWHEGSDADWFTNIACRTTVASFRETKNRLVLRHRVDVWPRATETEGVRALSVEDPSDPVWIMLTDWAVTGVLPFPLPDALRERIGV